MRSDKCTVAMAFRPTCNFPTKQIQMLPRKLSMLPHFVLISRENTNQVSRLDRLIDYTVISGAGAGGEGGNWNRSRFNEYLCGAFDVCCAQYLYSMIDDEIKEALLRVRI